ncbi:MAG: HAD-IC family P-type ATPase, partial [Nocardioidaceae bacterium]
MSAEPSMSLTLPGLSTAAAEARAAQEGPNRLPQPPRPSPLLQLTKQFTHLLALLLWVAAGLALLAGLPPLAVAIVVVVVLNAVFAFVQEYRADRSADRLNALLPTMARVRRDGQLRTVDAVTLVRDDVVLLASGDRIGADMHLTHAHSLSVDESLVTGESTAVRHQPGDTVMAGTFVIQGEAEAVVVAIGADTTIAGISALTRQATRPPSPLTVHLNGVVRAIAVIAVATGALLGVAGVVLGLDGTDAFLFAVGVTVALVPEGLLPTVTLSLARGAQLMAGRKALVRRLDSVETLGATTFICTDKTGTLTQNQMAVVETWTPAGTVTLRAHGYEPTSEHQGTDAAVTTMTFAAESAVLCVAGRVVQRDDRWVAEGDPMEAAIHCWALGVGWRDGHETVELRQPFTSDRLLSSVVVAGVSHVLGAPEAVLRRTPDAPAGTLTALHEMTHRGLRVVAVARRPWDPSHPPHEAEERLELMALVGLEDPPRPDVADALQSCRDASIRVAMVTGDHPGTA